MFLHVRNKDLLLLRVYRRLCLAESVFLSLPDGRITAPLLDRRNLIEYLLLNNLFMRLVSVDDFHIDDSEDVYEGQTSQICGGLVCTSYKNVYLGSTTLRYPAMSVRCHGPNAYQTRLEISRLRLPRLYDPPPSRHERNPEEGSFSSSLDWAQRLLKTAQMLKFDTLPSQPCQDLFAPLLSGRKQDPTSGCYRSPVSTSCGPADYQLWGFSESVQNDW